jgi:hypothetical protein
MGMASKNYHIPIGKLDPTAAEVSWVMEHIAPKLYPALDIIKGAFDRVDIPQAEFTNWPQRLAVLAHFDELGINIKRFACFIGHPHNATRTAHIDAYQRGVPMVARFNIPILGQQPASVSWWDDDINSDNIQEREFSELRYGQVKTAYSYGSAINDWGDTPAYTVHNPGACWNRTELAHRPWAGDCNTPRILITTETAVQISWSELVKRLERAGHC